MYLSLIRVPPHTTLIPPFEVGKPTIAAHGHVPTFAGSPPNILRLFEIPHPRVVEGVVVGMVTGLTEVVVLGCLVAVGNIIGLLEVVGLLVVVVLDVDVVDVEVVGAFLNDSKVALFR